MSLMIRVPVLIGLLLLVSTCFAESGSASGDIEIGRRIYFDGILPSGALLKGTRLDGVSFSGAEAACVVCHRRSGMGSVEGALIVPPVTSKYLFTSDNTNVAVMDQRRRKSFNQAHDPYTDDTLAQAIRSGVNNSGREMSVVMPHFDLNNAEMKALIAYLKQLSLDWSPGVTADTIHFATVITPDVKPARRQALLDILNSTFLQKNASTVTGAHAGGRRHMVSAAEMIMGTERNWTLDVWDLKGSPDTWGAQLIEHYQSQPVFALLSGLSETTWAPVHDFCRNERVPCWFPSVALPEATPNFYSVYFSRGLFLEAEILARNLIGGEKKPRQLVQAFRDDDVGRKVSQAFTRALSGSGVRVEDRVLNGNDPAALRALMSGLESGDSVVFWLNQADVSALGTVAPISGVTSYFSVEMAGSEYSPLPRAWKNDAKLIYVYDLPDRRQISMSYFHTWLKLRKIALVDEPLQSEVYFAVTFLSDTLAEMLDNLFQDYLLERAENMLSQREGSKAEQEARDRVFLGRTGDLEQHYPNRKSMKETRNLVGLDSRTAKGNNDPVGTVKREGTTIYPRLSLAPGQRFASKGGYIVHLDRDNGDRIVTDSEWIVP